LKLFDKALFSQKTCIRKKTNNADAFKGDYTENNFSDFNNCVACGNGQALYSAKTYNAYKLKCGTN
jgi:hypothetical protein